MQQSVYDRDGFFERYQQLRSNSVSLNEIVEKPTMLSLLPSLTGKNCWIWAAVAVSIWRCICNLGLSLWLVWIYPVKC